MNNNTLLTTNIELLDEGEAFASVSLNPYYQWAKIVVTDDLPNANKMKIPKEEFPNMIRTGLFSPIKMAEKEISDGHPEAHGKPIGTIAQLLEESNKLIALAALWKKEKPEEITLLKEMFKKGTLPQVSWEVSYEDSSIEDDIEVLKGVILNGLAVVGLPAYMGRTPFLAMSSKNKEETPVEELDILKNKVEEQRTEIDNLKTKLSEKEIELADKVKVLSEKETEIASLVEFKDKVEKEKSEADKIASIKVKFTEAKLTKDEEYFNKNRETLLALSDTTLDFMIQEMVSLVPNKQSSSSKVPLLGGDSDEEIDLEDPKQLAQELRKRN